jgi:ribosomal protein S27E
MEEAVAYLKDGIIFLKQAERRAQTRLRRICGAVLVKDNGGGGNVGSVTSIV